MAGNVAEWAADWFDVYPGDNPEAADTFGDECRVVWGGGWNMTGAIGTTYRVAGDPDEPFASTGVGCVRSL